MGEDVMGGVSDQGGGADAARPPSAEEVLRRLLAATPATVLWKELRSRTWEVEEVDGRPVAHPSLHALATASDKALMEELRRRGVPVTVGNDAEAIISDLASKWLVAELRRRGDRRVTLATDLEDPGPSVDELMEAARVEGYHAGVEAEAGLEGALGGRPFAEVGYSDPLAKSWVAATCAWLAAEAAAHRLSGNPPADHADALEWTAEALWSLSSAAEGLVGVIRRAGGGQVEGLQRTAVEAVEEALAADPLAPLEQPDVPRGTCPAPTSHGARRPCGRPAAPGEENLCVRHAAEADKVASMVLELVRMIRYPSLDQA